MNAVFEKTQELGDALMQSDEYKAMKAAEDVAMKNAEAAALMTSYIEHKNQLDELTRVTEGSKIDEGEFADKLGTAMEKVNIKAEAVISSRRVAAEIASDMDKEQGETLAMRDRGVI